MLEVYFIRHAKTFGNTLKRYIGKTDESLCEEGTKILENNEYPKVEAVYVSPMARCIETAEIIYKDMDYCIYENLRECDFGDFENKNYQDLADNEDYQKWIESNGTMAFPRGEDVNDFKNRCVKAFDEIIEEALNKGYRSISLVVHGGTIMSILDKYSKPHKDYYSWSIENGEVLRGVISKDKYIIV